MTNKLIRVFNNLFKPITKHSIWLCFCFYGSVVVAQTQTQPTEQEAAALSSHSAEAWLGRMGEAVKSLNYQLSLVVVVKGKEPVPYLWRHAVKPDGTSIEQVSLLNGPGREMVRVNGQVSYIEPYLPPYTLNSNMINSPLPVAFFRTPLAYDAAYEFIHVGRNRIAGRAAQHLRVISRDNSRHSYNLWLDQETGLPLKFEMVNESGQWIEQLQITDLSVNTQADEFITRLENAKLPPVLNIKLNQVVEHPWQLGYQPIGMQELSRKSYVLPNIKAKVDYLMLSDGLIDVSVYLRHVKSSNPGQEIRVVENANIVVSRTYADYEITVIGKLPLKTVQAIANSVNFSTSIN